MTIRYTSLNIAFLIWVDLYIYELSFMYPKKVKSKIKSNIQYLPRAIVQNTAITATLWYRGVTV